MKRFQLVILLLVTGVVSALVFNRLMIRESGHGFPIGNKIVLCEYGYTHGGDRLNWAIIRTFPIDSTTEQRMADSRVSRGYLFWPLVRDSNGQMVPVGTNGNVYFFEDDTLKTMRVQMNEHTDTMPLDDSKTLAELWTYLQKFRVD